MKRIVIDASVLVKLYIDEAGSDRAAYKIKNSQEILAPDLLWPEVGNILWKYVRRKEFDVITAKQMLSDMLLMPIELTDTSDLISQALEIAAENDRSVYDSLYLATAIKADAIFLTADMRLVNSLANTSLTKFVQAL